MRRLCSPRRQRGRRSRSRIGVGLSPDGTVLYWAETPTRQVQRRRLVAPGEVQSADCDVRALFRPAGADRYAVLAGLPGCHELDSLAIDSAGSVVVGTLVDSGVSEIRVDGSWTWHTLPPPLADPLVKKRIEETGSLIVGNTPEEFTKQIAAEFEVYKKVVALQKLKLD